MYLDSHGTMPSEPADNTKDHAPEEMACGKEVLARTRGKDVVIHTALQLPQCSVPIILSAVFLGLLHSCLVAIP